MKDFFKKIWGISKTLFTGYANKHQKCLAYGSLILALVLSLLFGTILSALVSYAIVLFSELVYCFVPTKSIRFNNKWYEIPDFKEFKNNKDKYIATPRNAFKTNNLWFVFVGIAIFILIRLIFLIF